MKKLILRINDEIKDSKAVEYVQYVINQQKISKTSMGEQYCFHIGFKDGANVSVVKHKSGTETFYINNSSKKIH